MVERFCKAIRGSPLPIIVVVGIGSPENSIGKVGGFMGIESGVTAKRGQEGVRREVKKEMNLI